MSSFFILNRTPVLRRSSLRALCHTCSCFLFRKGETEMALDSKLADFQADIIVRDCISSATKFNGQIKAQNKLSEVGVLSDLMLQNLIDLIAHEPNIGVGRFGFTIDSGWFDSVSLGTKVFEVMDIVSANAQPNVG